MSTRSATHPLDDNSTNVRRSRGTRPPATLSPPVAKICRALDIEIISRSERRRGRQTCAVQTIEGIYAQHGGGHLTIVLRSIAETEGNETQLSAPVIAAMSDVVLAHPEATATSNWLNSLDAICLADLHRRAKAMGFGEVRETLRVLILDAVDRSHLRILPTPRERRPQMGAVEALELGAALLALRAGVARSDFKRVIYDKAKLTRARAGQLMRVAKLYGNRADAVARLSLDALCLLASSTTSDAVRSEVERRLARGERISAAAIEAMRRRHRERETTPSSPERAEAA